MSTSKNQCQASFSGKLVSLTNGMMDRHAPQVSWLACHWPNSVFFVAIGPTADNANSVRLDVTDAVAASRNSNCLIGRASVGYTSDTLLHFREVDNQSVG